MAEFIKKDLEPKLSIDMQNVIRRSKDPNSDAPRSDEIIRMKYKIKKMLCSNQDILNTLHNDKLSNKAEVINGDDYFGVNIFDYMRTPDLKDEVHNYVCYEVDDSKLSGIRVKRIYFRVISHKDDCATDWNINRCDLLAAIIKERFDWTNEFGLKLEKYSDLPNVTREGYYYRDIVYLQRSEQDEYNRVNSLRY